MLETCDSHFGFSKGYLICWFSRKNGPSVSEYFLTVHYLVYLALNPLVREASLELLVFLFPKCYKCRHMPPYLALPLTSVHSFLKNYIENVTALTGW